MSWAEAGARAGAGHRNGWCLTREGDVLTLSRRVPVRFDIMASAEMPAGAGRISRARLAHQLRQDVWRCLRDLRGFWPAVRIARGEGVLHVTVGGALEGARVPVAQAEARLADLLASPAHRARWLRHAGGAV